MNKFKKVTIEMKYPNPTFDQYYEEVKYLKENIKNIIFINVFINGINKTDMKFRDNFYIDSFQIGSDIKYIDDKSFYSCFSLKRVKIPLSVTKIGKNAFNDCSHKAKKMK